MANYLQDITDLGNISKHTFNNLIIHKYIKEVFQSLTWHNTSNYQNQIQVCNNLTPIRHFLIAFHNIQVGADVI